MILLAAACLCGGQTSPAIAISCHSGPYIIFFDANSDKLDDDDRLILDGVRKAANGDCFATSRIFLVGHADAVSDKKPVVLSQKRIKAVKRHLLASGLKKTRFRSYQFGSSRPLFTDLAKKSESQNRRVEISFRPAQSN